MVFIKHIGQKKKDGKGEQDDANFSKSFGLGNTMIRYICSSCSDRVEFALEGERIKKSRSLRSVQ